MSYSESMAKHYHEKTDKSEQRFYVKVEHKSEDYLIYTDKEGYGSGSKGISHVKQKFTKEQIIKMLDDPECPLTMASFKLEPVE